MIKLSSLLSFPPASPPARAFGYSGFRRLRRAPHHLRCIPSRGFAGTVRLAHGAGSLTSVRLPLPAGYSPASGSLIFRGYSVFKGQSHPQASIHRLTFGPRGFDFLPAGFLLFFPSPLQERRTLLYQFHGFCQGFFSRKFYTFIIRKSIKNNEKSVKNFCIQT